MQCLANSTISFLSCSFRCPLESSSCYHLVLLPSLCLFWDFKVTALVPCLPLLCLSVFAWALPAGLFQFLPSSLLCSNSGFCSVCLKWFSAMTAMRFLHQPVGSPSLAHLHSFLSVCVPNNLQSEAGLPVSNSITKLGVLCWGTAFETQESQSWESDPQYLLKSRNQNKVLCNLLKIHLFKTTQQLSPQHQKTLGISNFLCHPVSRLLWCNNWLEILIALSFWNL